LARGSLRALFTTNVSIQHHFILNIVTLLIAGKISHLTIERGYLRPLGEITFHSGACGAWVWFELPENPTCPFKDDCGAYLNKAPPQGLESNAPTAVEEPGDSSRSDEACCMWREF
jgi:hypothetical protein